jgi:hypothetical protein
LKQARAMRRGSWLAKVARVRAPCDRDDRHLGERINKTLRNREFDPSR